MIRIGKTLLVIGCLSLTSAACASDDATTHAEKMRKLLVDRASFLDTVVAAIERDKPTYDATRMPDNSGTLYTARTKFPDGMLRTITALKTTAGIKSATVLDVKRAYQAENDKVSSARFEGPQALSIFIAIKKHGIKE